MLGFFKRVKPDVEAAKARDALAAGRADEAAAHCETALKADPKHAECRTLLARAYDRLGRVGDAIEAYEAACTAAPSYPNFIGAASLYVRAADWAKAEAKFHAAVGKFPTSIPAWTGLADARRRLGKLDLVVQCLDMLVSLQPDRLGAKRALADACAEIGDASRAAGIAHAVLEDEPDSVRALHCLANCHAAAREWDDAIRAYRRLLKLAMLDAGADPAAKARLHHDLATALRQVGNVDEALAHLEATRELQPNFLPAYRDQLETHRQKGNTAEAIAVAEAALELAPDEPAIWHDLGQLRLTDGDAAAALKAFARAIELRPGYTEAIAGSALALSAAGKHGRAIAICEKLALKRAFQALPHLTFARVLRGTGDLHAALREADLAVNIAPTDPEAAGLKRDLLAEIQGE